MAARTRASNWFRSCAGTPSSSPITATGRGKASSRVTSTLWPHGRRSAKVSEPLAQGHHMRAQGLDRSRRERTGDEAAQTGVVRGIEREHRLPALEELDEVLHLLFGDAPAGDPHAGRGVLVGALAQLRSSQSLLAVPVSA